MVMRRRLNRVVVGGFLSALALVSASCGENPAVSQQRAELELARMKGDLDAIFLATSALADLGDTAADTALPGLKESLSVRERMRLARADHDHEKALLAAEDLLHRVPSHQEATAVLRESGQIFYYLSAAKEAVVNFADESGDTEVVEAKAVDPISTPAGLSGDQLQAFWIGAAQQLLARLDYAVGALDGVAGPSTRAAVKSFRERNGGAAVDTIDESLVRELEQAVLQQASAEADKARKQRAEERRMYRLAQGRAYIGKARLLDPQFKNSESLEQLLAQAHTASVYSAVLRLRLQGELSLFMARYVYSEAIQTLGRAAASRYATVSGAWARYAPVISSTRHYVDPKLAELKHIVTVLNTYEHGEAMDLVSAARDYAIVVEQAVNAYLDPTGNLIQYREAGAKAAADSSTALSRVDARLPQTESVQKNFEGLLQTVEAYRIYSDERAAKVVENHREMYAL